MHVDQHPRAVDHAATRWARVLITLLTETEDPRTLRHWSRAAGLSVSSLHQVCNTVGLGAKASLDFGRLCRIVQLAREEEWDPANLLEVADARTLTRLLRDGGLTEAHRTRRAPVMEAFLVGQRLVTGPANLRAVRCHLRAVATTAAPREVLRAALAPTPADRLAS